MWMKEFCTTQPDALISSATMEIGIEFLLEYQASSIDIAESLNMGLLSTMLAHENSPMGLSVAKAPSTDNSLCSVRIMSI